MLKGIITHFFTQFLVIIIPKCLRERKTSVEICENKGFVLLIDLEQ